MRSLPKSAEQNLTSRQSSSRNKERTDDEPMGTQRNGHLAAALAIYTYGAIFLAFVLTGLFVYLRFAFGNAPLQQFYTPIYLRTTIASQLGKDRKDKYKMLFISSVEAGPKPALEPDVAPSSTEQPGSKPFPLVPSQAALRAGYDALSLGPETSYFDSRLRDYLRQSVYSDNSLWSIYERPVLLGFLTLLIQLPFSIRKDIKRRLQMKYGRLLKGPVMLTPAEFNQQNLLSMRKRRFG
jgi:hypothetical protein